MGSKFLGRAVKVVIASADAAAPPIKVIAAEDYKTQALAAAAAFIGRPDYLTGTVATGQAPQTPTFGKAFTGLHVNFKIEKDLQGSPNTLELSIYNLAAATRKQLQNYGMFVELYAGYQSDIPNLPLVFKGTTRTIDHVRQGADWVTRIRSGDGEQAYRFGQANQQFAPGAQSAEVAKYLANQIKAADPKHLDVSAFIAGVVGLSYPKPSYVHGHTVCGNAFTQLCDVLGDTYQLSIQDGSLLALAALEAKQRTVTIPLISPSTGMVGSPDHGDPNLAGLPSVLKVTSLLRGTLLPGDLVQVQSSQTSGTFKIQKLRHVGDLAANDWQTELELYSPGQGPTP